jgi:nickel-dependent lactate racemase
MMTSLFGEGDSALKTTTIQVKYGTAGLSVGVPTRNLLGILTPSEPVLPPSEDEEIERALRNPTGSPRLEDMVRSGMNVVIMASDVMRPSPTARLLPPLLDRLNKAGVSDSKATIVFGMGIHRGHTTEEKKALVGADIFQRCRCVDSTDSDDFVRVGTTSRGTPVEVNRLVHECDFLIATGNVEYHYFAGYSGGAKAILPGACSRRTVEANHSMQLLPGAETGSYDENPVRQDIEEAGRMVGLDFILNVVLDPGKRIVRAVAGDPVVAHAEARRVTDAVYGVEIHKYADIVIASPGGRPKDMNLYQAQKGLENAKYAVREGGIIILAAECPESLGEANFEKYMTGMEIDEIIESVRRKFVLGAHKAAAVARVLKKADVYLVSAMDKTMVERCRLTPLSSLGEALGRAFSVLGSDAKVWVMPYAGSTVPRYRPRSIA